MSVLSSRAWSDRVVCGKVVWCLNPCYGTRASFSTKDYNVLDNCGLTGALVSFIRTKWRVSVLRDDHGAQGFDGREARGQRAECGGISRPPNHHLLAI